MVIDYSKDILESLVQETISELESIKNKNQLDHQTCPHHFGYLADIPSHSLIPEECLLCSKVIKCALFLEKNSSKDNDH